MERTSLGVDDRLRRRLDLLETRGRRVLSAMARRRALRRALTWAAPASAVGPAVLAVSAFFAVPSPASAFIAVAAVPFLAAVLGYVRARPTSERPRTAALALLDHRLKLTDRLQTSDEFEQLEARSGFHDAALREAAPWVARAQDSALAENEGPFRLSRTRLWLWPTVGLLCLATAFVVPHFGANTLASATLGSGDTAPREAVAPFDVPAAIESTASGSATSSDDSETPARSGQDRAGEGRIAAFRNLIARLATSEGGLGASQDAIPLAETPSQAVASGQEGAGSGGQGAAGGRALLTGSARASGGGQPNDDAPQMPGVASAEDDSRVSASQAVSGQFAGARQTTAPSPSQPQPREPGSGPAQNGEGQQPGRSRRGNQGQSGREQTGGSGPGQNSGANSGAKKGRGVSSLILATPMQDRLSGMVSPGRVLITTRSGVPQPLPAAGVRAQDRGAAQGEAARTAPLTASAQEQRVTRDYFSARNGGGR